MGGAVQAVVDVVSDVGEAVGGAVADVGEVVGGAIGDAGEFIDKSVLQPALQDPLGTVVKIAAIAAAPATGGASLYAIPAYTAAKAIDAGLPIEDVAFMTAVSAAATAAGVEVGDYIGTMAEFGTDLGSQQTAMLAAQNAGIGTGSAVSTAAGQVAGGATSGAIGATATGRDPVTGLLSGAANAGISAGVNTAFDTGAGLFNQTNTGRTGMDELFNTTGEDFNMGGIFGGTGEDFNMGGGGLYGQFNMNTGTGEDFNMSGDAQFNAYLQSTPGLLDYAKQFGVQAAKALIGGGSRPAGQGGTAGGTGTQGGLLGAGANYFLSDAARRAIQSASQQSTQQQLEATRRAEQFATFKPVGVTTAFGQSNFGFDPTTGQLTSAGYTATPQIAAQREKLFTLGAEALPTTADTAALQQQYLEQQRGLLAPSREQQLAQLRNRQYQRGTGGLATGGTVAGYAPGAGGLMQTNPEMAAYYNALAREDATLGANAPIYAQDLLNKRIATGTGLFTQAGALETMAQQPLTLGAGLGAQVATAGSRAGLYGLTGAQGAAQTQLYGNVANASGQLGQAQGLLTGVSPYLQQAGNYAINNWLS
jgi:hypothetical protein